MLKKAANWTYSFSNNAIQRRINSDHYIQVGKTEFDIIYHQDITTVRHYRPLEVNSIIVADKEIPVEKQQHRIPLILVPPLGVYSWIFDILIERSLVRYLLARGFDLYLIDWGAPEKSSAHISLKDYTLDWMPEAVNAVRDHSKQQDVSLMGYCMGGLLSLIYAACNDDTHIQNLVTIASPIDFQRHPAMKKASNLVAKPLRALEKITNHEKVIDITNRFYHMDGKRLSLLFKMSNPQSTVSSYINLLKNMADSEYVSNHMSMAEWFNNMPDYPGATVREIVKNFNFDNQLAKGEIKLDSNTSGRFDKIESNLLAFAGDNDKIVSIGAAKKVLEIVSSKDKTFHVVPGGHAGLFAGSKAANTTWTISADWLADRSA